jgi:hypothetical protein
MPLNKRRTVFISGSAYEYGRFGDTGKAFVRNLTKTLLNNNFRIVSGFGLGVGSAVVEGALDEVYLKKKTSIAQHLRVYPFASHDHPEELKTGYRTDMIAQAGIAIFIFGNKLQDIAIREADGMIEEFQIALSNKARLIPVGASGYVSEKLWREMILRFDEYFDSREKFELYEELGAPYTRHDRLIELIMQIAQHD